MTEQQLYYHHPRHSPLEPGVEFTAFASHLMQRKIRLRFRWAHVTAKGWELTGWDGDRMRTVPMPPNGYLEVHRTCRIPGGER